MKKYLKRLIALGALVTILIILLVLQTNTAVCEFFARTVSRAWIWTFGKILGWIPLSLYEWSIVLVILGIAAFLLFVIYFLVKKRYKEIVSLLLAVAIGGVAFADVYCVSASFAYNREPLPQYVCRDYGGSDLTYDEALQIADWVVAELNDAYDQTEHDADGNIVFPYSFSELNDLIAKEYERLDDDYFSPYTPRAKKIVNQTVMNELHISGVFFAPYGEPNVNVDYMNMTLPSTIAHELAHSKGVMRESDANTVAAYLLLTSDNVYLRYSALTNCFLQAVRLVKMYPNSLADFNLRYGSISDGVFKEIANYSKYYKQFTALDNLGTFFNNIYLKLNGQGGTNSYVKPSQTEDTGQKDDDGEPILTITGFSNLQNVLIGLYKNGYMK